MYIDTITTQMSMHANSMGIALSRSNVTNGFDVGGWCRGMLARPGSKGSGGTGTPAGGHRDVEHTSPTGLAGGSGHVGMTNEAGPSRSGARRGGRRDEGGSSSDAD